MELRSQGVNEARSFASRTHMTDSMTVPLCHMTDSVTVSQVSDATHALLPLTVTNIS